MKTSRITSMVLAAGLFFAPSARAAYDAFLKLGDIKGESTDAQHKDWIEIDSYQFGAVQSSAASATSGAGAGKVRFGPFQITKRVDKASPRIFAAAGTGQNLGDATIDIRKAGGSPQEFITIKLKDAYITNLQSSGGGGPQPTESFALNYGRIEIDYRPQQTDHAGAAQNVKVAPGALSGAGVQPTPAHTPTAPREMQLAPGALVAALPPVQITGVSASAPQFGTNATITITSTGACSNARVDWGDGSANQFFKLTGTSTPLPAHTYSSPGMKTIRVGGPDASYWQSPGVQKRQPAARQGDCTGEAQTQVTLRLALAPAPVVR